MSDLQKPASLVLGVDGGGSGTRAALAPWQHHAPALGRGQAGPSNLQVVGFDAAMDQIARCVTDAFRHADVAPAPVRSACLALAGAGAEVDRRRISEWVQQRGIARRVLVVHDARAVLQAGTPGGWGAALLSGTGSFVFARDRTGRETRVGGWGPLLGDEGSGYQIALAGLRAAARTADGRAAGKRLLAGLLERFELHEPQRLVAALTPRIGDRAWLAALAEVVFQAARESDPEALRILGEAASELSQLVATAARRLDLHADPFPLACAGSVLVRNPEFQAEVIHRLAPLGLRPQPVQNVPDPVEGALALART